MFIKHRTAEGEITRDQIDETYVIIHYPKAVNKIQYIDSNTDITYFIPINNIISITINHPDLNY